MESVKSRVESFHEQVVSDWASDETASAWQRHYESVKRQLAQVTASLVEAARLEPGMSVLDLASGVGEPSISIARRVGPSGRVVATDISGAMLGALEENARREGVGNLQARVADAHDLPFPDASFDRVTSRFGIMFFAEVERALAEIKRVLKPGGMVTFLVWGAPQPGTYFGAAGMPFVQRLPEKPDPDGPGPMRFAETGKLIQRVAGAGFRQTTEEILNVPAPFDGSPEELMATLMDMAKPFRNMVESLPREDREAAEKEALHNLSELYRDGKVHVTAPVLIVCGVKES